MPSFEAGQPAGAGKRVAARIIDNFINSFVVGLVLAVVWQGVHSKAQTDAMVIFWCLPLELAQLLAFKGKTLGKMLLGLRVVDLDTGNAPSLSACLKRVVVFPGIELILFLGPLWALIDFALASRRDAYRRATWDKWAGTAVVRSR